MKFIVEQTKRITGLSDFGEYMSKVLTIDSFFLNEDRHTHNIAVLMNGSGEFAYCPIFDNGAGLLADTTMDYPLSGNVLELIESARSKTFCPDFDEQLEIAEELYGQQIKFYFTKQDVIEILKKTDYDVRIKERVETIILDRMRRYQYLL